jgi:hypothetical protein
VTGAVRDELPTGYVVLAASRARAVGLATLAEPLAAALSAGSFYAYAAHRPDARALVGRGVAYAVPLPGDAARVVVRRSRHGGLLAPLTGELFVPPTRAPRELRTAVRLTEAGVPTPEVVAFATYTAGASLRRADVVTREVPDGVDLLSALGDHPTDEQRRALLGAVARLLALLTIAGARHPDLNVKNILVRNTRSGAIEALVLDVDRVWFDQPGAPRVTARNLGRLARSARKWRRRRAFSLADTDLGWLAATTHELAFRVRAPA